MSTGQENIIDDRMGSINLRSSVKKTLNHLSQEMNKNYFKNLDAPTAHERIEILSSQCANSPYRSWFLQTHENEWNMVSGWTKDKITETKENEEILSDYSRDVIVAKSTRSNIALQKTNVSLQKSVRALTFFATLLAFSGIAVSLFPERVKDNVFYFISERIASLFALIYS